MDPRSVGHSFAMAETASAAALSADDKGASMESSVGEVVAAALACKDNGPAMADALLVLRTKLVSDGEPSLHRDKGSPTHPPTRGSCRFWAWQGSPAPLGPLPNLGGRAFCSFPGCRGERLAVARAARVRAPTRVKPARLENTNP